MLGRQ
ncbi:helix-turn-helix family protein, partial [Vibrio cholerae HC-47A1]